MKLSGVITGLLLPVLVISLKACVTVPSVQPRSLGLTLLMLHRGNLQDFFVWITHEYTYSYSVCASLHRCRFIKISAGFLYAADITVCDELVNLHHIPHSSLVMYPCLSDSRTTGLHRFIWPAPRVLLRSSNWCCLLLSELKISSISLMVHVRPLYTGGSLLVIHFRCGN